jgi:hypothetical protein
VAVRESLTSPAQLSNVHVQTFREYLAAMTLAWAGAHVDAVGLLEKVMTAPAGIGPARIVREPLFSVPLREDHRYQALARRLEAEIQENQRAEMVRAPQTAKAQQVVNTHPSQVHEEENRGVQNAEALQLFARQNIAFRLEGGRLDLTAGTWCSALSQ